MSRRRFVQRKEYIDNRPLALVVDEESRIAKLLAEILSLQCPVRTVPVCTVQEAVSILNRETPAAIITRQIGAYAFGSDLCTAIRRNPRTKHIVMALMTYKRFVPEHVLAWGFDVYWPKPTDLQVIIGDFNRLLAEKAHRTPVANEFRPADTPIEVEPFSSWDWQTGLDIRYYEGRDWRPRLAQKGKPESPRERKSEPSSECTRTTPRAAPKQMKPTRTRTVIVVEPKHPERLRGIVKSAGMRSRAATSLAEFLAVLAVTPPRLIICEHELPDGDGVELCRQFRGNPKWSFVPFMLLTANEITQERLSGAGVDAYVRKPCRPSKIIATAKRLLTQQKKSRSAKRLCQ